MTYSWSLCLFVLPGYQKYPTRATDAATEFRHFPCRVRELVGQYSKSCQYNNQVKSCVNICIFLSWHCITSSDRGSLSVLAYTRHWAYICSLSQFLPALPTLEG